MPCPSRKRARDEALLANSGVAQEETKLKPTAADAQTTATTNTSGVTNDTREVSMNMERDFFANSPTEAVDDAGDDEIENEEGNSNLFLHRDATLKNEKKRKTGEDKTRAGDGEDNTGAEGVDGI